MITHAQALDALRLDEDVTTTGLVQSYIDALPALIEAWTGVPATEIRESDDALLLALETFLVQLLYCPDGSDADRLQKTIDSLSGTIKAVRVAQGEQ